VAEGVEDMRACDRLIRLGCDYAQGFAIARPMPGDDMLRWLLARGQPDDDPARRARRRAT
jgi:EAL domain-containing protein (putative c-di-GMP-specific phosphodiesterase class I)